MYTHTGLKGLAARESLDIDPVLNRNRKWHACRHVTGNTYKALCGVRLTAVAPEDSCWGARVEAKDAHRITCRRCTKVIQTLAQDVNEATPHRPTPTPPGWDRDPCLDEPW